MKSSKAVVIVRCITCRTTREEGPNRDPYYVPICNCGGIMVAVAAKLKPRKAK